jgi:hypothetical protein
MSNKPIEIQLKLPDGRNALGGRKVKLHSTGMFGGTNVSSSGTEYTTQINGIVQLSGDWRENDITHVYLYDEKGSKTEYVLKDKTYVPRDGSGPVEVKLKKP